jgi:hypothetical protein
MGLRRTKVMKNTFSLVTALQESVALPFVIPSGHGPQAACDPLKEMKTACV